MASIVRGGLESFPGERLETVQLLGQSGARVPERLARIAVDAAQNDADLDHGVSVDT
jgi:hypothetical protein